MRKEMYMDQSGGLIIRALGAGEAFPIPDSIVRVRGSDKENKNIIYTVFTDEDGVTRRLTLPAPDAENSSSPYAPKPPYYNYEVTVEKEGYYPKMITGVSVFPGVLSVLTVNMIPIVGFNDGGRYPRENLIMQSEE